MAFLQAVVSLVTLLCVSSLPFSACVYSWRHSSSGANVGPPTHFSESNHCHFSEVENDGLPLQAWRCTAG